ncbi:hypothetical protein ACFL0W_05395 [Nanoarchaeota archaeon]
MLWRDFLITFIRPNLAKVIYFIIFLVLLFSIVFVVNDGMVPFTEICIMNGDAIDCQFSILNTAIFVISSLIIFYFLSCLVVNDFPSLKSARYVISAGLLILGLLTVYDEISRYALTSNVYLFELIIGLVLVGLSISMVYHEIKRSSWG